MLFDDSFESILSNHDCIVTDMALTLPPLPAVLLGMFSVQCGAALAKNMFPALGPVGTVSLRIGLSAAVLCAVFRPRLLSMQRKQWRIVIAYGIVLAIMNLSFYLALARIPLGLAVTLEFTGPLSIAVLGSRRVTDFLWVLLAMAGIALIAPWQVSANVDTAGVLLALAAGVCWAIYIVVGSRMSRVLAAGPGVAAGMLLATVVIVPFTIASHSLSHLTPNLLLSGLGVALLSSALPYSLEMMALRSIPARTFGILMSLEPAIGALSGLLLLGEHLNSKQWAAVGCVMIASAGATVTTRHPAESVTA